MRQFRWAFWLGGIIISALVVLVGLPYFLPLGGPPTINPAELADANGAFIQLGEETLYYTHHAGDGEPVILLHGFGGSTVTWVDTLPALTAAGYDAYAVDLAGFGLSDKGWARDYGHASQAARVIALMDALGIDRTHIIGHSMGGNVAAHIALSHPDRVNRLILVAGAIDIGQNSAGDSSFLPVPPSVFELAFARRWGQILMRQLLVPQFESLLFDAAYDDAALTPAIKDGYRRVLYTPDWDLGLMGIMRDQDRQELPLPLSQLVAPTLLLWGIEDSWVPPETADQLEIFLPNVTRIDLPNTGHLPMHEAPDQFNRAIIDFLQGKIQP